MCNPERKIKIIHLSQVAIAAVIKRDVIDLESIYHEASSFQRGRNFSLAQLHLSPDRLAVPTLKQYIRHYIIANMIYK